MKDDTMLFNFDPEKLGLNTEQHIRDADTINDGDTLRVTLSTGIQKEMGNLLPSPAKNLVDVVTENKQLVFKMDGEIEYLAGELSIDVENITTFPVGSGLLSPSGTLKPLEGSGDLSVNELTDKFTIDDNSTVNIRYEANVFNINNSSYHKQEVTLTKDQVNSINNNSGEYALYSNLEFKKGLTEVTLQTQAEDIHLFSLLFRDLQGENILAKEFDLINKIHSKTITLKMLVETQENKKLNLFLRTANLQGKMIDDVNTSTNEITSTYFELSLKHIPLDRTKLIEYTPPAGEAGIKEAYDKATNFLSRQPIDLTYRSLFKYELDNGYQGALQFGDEIIAIPGFSSYLMKYNLSTNELFFERTPELDHRFDYYLTIGKFLYLFSYTNKYMYKYNLESKTFTKLDLPVMSNVNGLFVDPINNVPVIKNTSNALYKIDEAAKELIQIPHLTMPNGEEILAVDLNDKIYGKHLTFTANTYHDYTVTKISSDGKLIDSSSNIIGYGENDGYSISLKKVYPGIPRKEIQAKGNGGGGVIARTNSFWDRSYRAYRVLQEDVTTSYSYCSAANPVMSEENPIYLEFINLEGDFKDVLGYSLYSRNHSSHLSEPKKWKLLGCKSQELDIPVDMNIVSHTPSYYGEANARFNFARLFRKHIDTSVHDQFDAYQANSTRAEMIFENYGQLPIENIGWLNGYYSTGTPPRQFELYVSDDNVRWSPIPLTDIETDRTWRDSVTFLKNPITTKFLRARSVNDGAGAGHGNFIPLIKDADNYLQPKELILDQKINPLEVTFADGTKLSASSAWNGFDVFNVSTVNSEYFAYAYTSNVGVDHWVKYEFPEVIDIYGLIATTGRTNYNNSDLIIEISDDGETWTEIDTFLNDVATPVISYTPEDYNSILFYEPLKDFNRTINELNNFKIPSPVSNKYIKLIFTSNPGLVCIARLYFNRPVQEDWVLIDNYSVETQTGGERQDFLFAEPVTYNSFRMEVSERFEGTPANYLSLGGFDLIQENSDRKVTMEKLNVSTNEVQTIELNLLTLDDFIDYNAEKNNIKFEITNDDYLSSWTKNSLIDGNTATTWISNATLGPHILDWNFEQEVTVSGTYETLSNRYYYDSGRYRYYQEGVAFHVFQGLNETTNLWEDIQILGGEALETHTPNIVFDTPIKIKGLRLSYTSVDNSSSIGVGYCLPMVKDSNGEYTLLNLELEEEISNLESRFVGGYVSKASDTFDTTRQSHLSFMRGSRQFAWNFVQEPMTHWLSIEFPTALEANSLFCTIGHHAHTNAETLLEYKDENDNWVEYGTITMAPEDSKPFALIPYKTSLSDDNEPRASDLTRRYFPLNKDVRYKKFRSVMHDSNNNRARLNELGLYYKNSVHTAKVENLKQVFTEQEKLLSNVDNRLLLNESGNPYGLLDSSNSNYFPIIDNKITDLVKLSTGDLSKLLITENREIVQLDTSGNKKAVLSRNDETIDLIPSDEEFTLFGGHQYSDAYSNGVLIDDNSKVFTIPYRMDYFTLVDWNTETRKQINMPSGGLSYYWNQGFYKYNTLEKLNEKVYTLPYKDIHVICTYPVGTTLTREKVINPRDGAIAYRAVPNSPLIPDSYIKFTNNSSNGWIISDINPMKTISDAIDNNHSVVMVNPTIDNFLHWEFKKPVSMNGIDIRLGYGDYPTSLKVLYSNDNETWTELSEYMLVDEDKRNWGWLPRINFDETQMKYLKIEVDYAAIARIFAVRPVTSKDTFVTDEYWRSKSLEGDVDYYQDDLYGDGNTRVPMLNQPSKFRTSIKLSNGNVLGLPYDNKYPIVIDTQTDTFVKIESSFFDGTVRNINYCFRLANQKIVMIDFSGNAYYLDETTFEVSSFPIKFEQDTYDSVLTKDGNRYFLCRSLSKIVKVNMFTLMNNVKSYEGIVISNSAYSNAVAIQDNLLFIPDITTDLNLFDLNTMSSNKPYGNETARYGQYHKGIRLPNGSIFLMSGSEGHTTEYMTHGMLLSDREESDIDFNDFMELEG